MHLTLPEKLLLLALDKNGSNPHLSQAYFIYSLAASVLMELLLQGKVAFSSDDKIVAVDNSSTKNDILDEAIQLCIVPNNKIYWVKYKKDAIAETVKEWIQVINQLPNLRIRFYERMYDKLIIDEQKKSFAFILPYTLRPVQNVYLKEKLIDNLRNVLDRKVKPTQYQLIFLNLIKDSHLLKSLFNIKWQDMKATKQLIKELTHQNNHYQLTNPWMQDTDSDTNFHYANLEHFGKLVDSIEKAIVDLSGNSNYD